METIYDSFGLELKIGDNICFTLSMRKDQKPIVKGKVTKFIYCESNTQCKNKVYAEIEYIHSPNVEWAKRENKLISKVLTDRVVKCY